MRLLIAVSLAALATAGDARGGTFHFDLTDAVGADFNSFPESVIDLNLQFSRIDGARIHISGEFDPGKMAPATIPPQTGPIIPTDTVNLFVRLGEIGTAWIDKRAYAIQDLKGLQNTVEFDLPLLGTTAPGVPVLFPSGSLPVNYDFLLDGRFGLAAGSTHFVASLYQVLESPQFELTEFVLELDGVAIPEPSTAAILLAAMACASFMHCGARHTAPPANV